MLLIRSLSRVSGSNYDLQFARSLYRLSSRRSYSKEADEFVEVQVNDTQKSASQDDVIESLRDNLAEAQEQADNNGSSSELNMNIGKKGSFASRLRANRIDQTVQQRYVPSPSSMLRNWEKLEERLPLNPINIRNVGE